MASDRVLLLVALWMASPKGSRWTARASGLYCGVEMMSPMLQPDQPEDCVVVEARVLLPNGRRCL